MDTPQFLKSFHLHEWSNPNLKLTEQERAHFHLREEVRDKKLVYKYVFSEPWRYMLKVEPNMITHAKMVDEILEQQIAQLNNYVERRHLGPTMQRAMNGSCWRWKYFEEKAKYRNLLMNMPLHRILSNATEDNQTARQRADIHRREDVFMEEIANKGKEEYQTL